MAERPNILWYCSDQQRFDTIGGLNNPLVNTPRLDAFMKEAVTFTHAHCQTQICTPSRASFLTGQYPSAVGLMGNGNDYFPPDQAERLITRVLADSGYDAANIGKLHLAGGARGQETRVNDGYRHFYYSHSHKGPNSAGHDYADWLREQGADPEAVMADQSPGSYRDGAKVKSFGGMYEPTADEDNIPPELHQTHWCTAKTIEFLEKNRFDDQPWLATVNPFDPHAPFDAPYEYYRRYDPESLPGAHFEDGDLEHQQKLVDAGVDFQSKPQHPDEWNHKKIQASYYAMIEQLDAEFGRLLDYLEQTGQRENTIVIYTSDHGEALCDHGMLLKGCRFFEGLVRVPLMISWPGHFDEDRVSDALVELIDINPTLYEAIGMEIPYYVQGRSLMPILTGESDGADHRDFVRMEFFGAIDHPDQTHATMYRDRRWKLVFFHGKDLFELYDLENDPWEHNDLSEDPAHRDVLVDLMRKSFDAQVYSHQAGPPRTMPF
ncbi:MAG: sulfatase-like hydrolase/transferase [Chloroflexota bacterium]|nr:sulfatase-like hydrolase/transferase [Chloroflexota bacterium]MDP6508182.1 sulfatase-like hydrolase/transferase [Chloroflexota bacterium]MDP6757882.1 sulfatase-like hydrolase/transferase [Chloroflexota bacterium]